MLLKPYTPPSTCPVHFFFLFPISRAASLIFGKVTHWRRPGRGRPARRRSRRSPPRTGVRTRCCRRSALTAGWRSWDGAGSCRRRCFGPGNHGRPSEALCCCCCLYDWVQIIQTQLSALLLRPNKKNDEVILMKRWPDVTYSSDTELHCSPGTIRTHKWAVLL